MTNVKRSFDSSQSSSWKITILNEDLLIFQVAGFQFIKPQVQGLHEGEMGGEPFRYQWQSDVKIM